MRASFYTDGKARKSCRASCASHARGLHLSAPFLPGFRQQRRELRVKSDDVEQINGESRQLTETKPDVPVARQKEVGPDVDADRASHVQEKDGGQ